MKIVVLDGYTLNPGDLDWTGLMKLGDVTVYDRTPQELTVERIGEAPIILTNKTVITEDTFVACPSVKYVGLLSTGTNVVDIAAAKKRGIIVTNIPGYSTMSVAQHTFSLLLECCNGAGIHSAAVRAGEWAKSTDFCFAKIPLVELEGKIMGVIGTGSIGIQVINIARSFGMKVIYTSRTKKVIEGAEWVDITELARLSDIISLHCPLTQDTTGLIDYTFLKGVKFGAILLNPSRGPIVVEEAVVDALNLGRLSYYAADVSISEPPSADSALMCHPKAVITPHIAWASKEARERLMAIAVANAQSWLNGSPSNAV